VLTHGREDVAANGDLVDDLEVAGVRERAAHRGQHQPVVVSHEYPKRLHLYF
jgi:hypothetical protein